MKIRSGFVSNSSSSSFVCEACGKEESGMNLELRWAEMAECKGGHTVCFGCIGSEPEDIYELPKEDCPCCTLKDVSDYAVNQYAYYLLGKTRADLEQEIRSKFKTEGELWQEIRK